MSEPPQNLVARDMGAVRYVACASPEFAARHGMPATLDALADAPLISENFLCLRQAVLAGLGVGIVPDYVIQDDLRRGAVVTTLDAYRLSIFGMRMAMLYMPNRHHTRATATFIDFILEQARRSGHLAD